MDKDIIIEAVENNIDINTSTNNIDINKVDSNITIEETNPSVVIEETTPVLSIILNERGPIGPVGPKGDTADFYKIVSQEIVNGYTQSSTLENNKLYTYIRDEDNIVIDTIITEV